MNQEPSKVTLDYCHLEKLFADRAKLYQREEVIGRLRKEIEKLKMTGDFSIKTLTLAGSDTYYKGRQDAFDEIAGMIDAWTKTGNGSIIDELRRLVAK